MWSRHFFCVLALLSLLLSRYNIHTSFIMATPTPPIILPVTGVARVKSVLSGDTVILLGKPVAPHLPQPEVIFTFEAVNAPR
jgi:hypothetical protein